jgi:hypothetical protein
MQLIFGCLTLNGILLCSVSVVNLSVEPQSDLTDDDDEDDEDYIPSDDDDDGYVFTLDV